MYVYTQSQAVFCYCHTSDIIFITFFKIKNKIYVALGFTSSPPSHSEKFKVRPLAEGNIRESARKRRKLHTAQLGNSLHQYYQIDQIKQNEKGVQACHTGQKLSIKLSIGIRVRMT